MTSCSSLIDGIVGLKFTSQSGKTMAIIGVFA
mgnify:CR=1 FL=1